jgi:predicted DNA binding CopG/RHH family protein
MTKPVKKAPAKRRSDPKSIPKFVSEQAERAFWESTGNDATEFFDVDSLKPATFRNLKPSTTSISLRLSDSLLEGIRREANRLDVPYQSLMKVWLSEKLDEAANH